MFWMLDVVRVREYTQGAIGLTALKDGKDAHLYTYIFVVFKSLDDSLTSLSSLLNHIKTIILDLI